MNTMNVTHEEPVLTRADRCEGCAAGAMVRVRTENIGTWLFCGHCFDRHKDALPGVTHVHDERNPIRRNS